MIIIINTDYERIWGKKPPYLCFEFSQIGWGNNKLVFKPNPNLSTSNFKSISYSLDDGDTWISVENEGTPSNIEISMSKGLKVLWKGVAKQLAVNGNLYSFFKIDGYNYNCNISGNVMSLLYGDDFIDKVDFPKDSSYNFCSLFNQCTNATFNGLVLPATTLTDYCYASMFKGCTSLTTAPELPATTLAQSCYSGMFNGCTSLTTTPELPATTLAQSCYSGMFNGCTSLTTTPELPATTLAQNCYANMFYGCTSLTTTPELPATTLAQNCYDSMFRGCTSLTTAPELPAITLVNNCYQNMFYGCTSLTTAPELPATTLGTYSNSYVNMFYGCTSLNYIKMLAISGPNSSSMSPTYNWVTNVAETGTFVKNSSATWDVTGVNGIPSGWTVEEV